MTKNAKNIYLFLCLLTVCLLIAAARQTQAASGEAPSPAAGYVLGEYEGRIALFDAADPAPLYVFEKSTAALPEADRTALKNGIPIEDADAMRRVMEDFF